jgi:hypothetical protein
MAIEFTRRHLLLAAPAALVLLGGGALAARMMAPPPSDLDLSLHKGTDKGLYMATLAPNATPIPVGAMHSWTVTVTAPDGSPAEGVAIGVDGGMPQHGHGLPTAPKVTADLGNGAHRIDGMKFSMTGWWEIRLAIDAAGGADKAVFNTMVNVPSVAEVAQR